MATFLPIYFILKQEKKQLIPRLALLSVVAKTRKSLVFFFAVRI